MGSDGGRLRRSISLLAVKARRVYRERYAEEHMTEQYTAEYVSLCREKGIRL
jgi:hypothetical protein